jgi:hypothetical protein
MQPNQTLCFADVHRFLTSPFDGDMHAKRVLSLANAPLGVVRTASLAVNTFGQGLALARGRITRHAIKQVDRLLSNEGIDIDADGHATIMLSLLTPHGRATRGCGSRSIPPPSGTAATNISIKCWYASLTPCRLTSRYALWPTVGSATRSSIGSSSMS